MKGYERNVFQGIVMLDMSVCQTDKEEKSKLGEERPFQSERTTSVKDDGRKVHVYSVTE